MKKKFIILLGLFLVVTVLAYNSLFFVEQRIQSLILQFGEPIRVIKEPGLNFEIPLAQNVVKFSLNSDLSINESPRNISFL